MLRALLYREGGAGPQQSEAAASTDASPRQPTTAMARAPPSQRLEAVPEDDDKTLQWGLVDFLGRYHKHAIASDFPVPGSAVSRGRAAEAQYKAHIDGIRDRVDNIQARKGESVQEKVRHETFALKALIQKRVGSTLDRVGATLEEIDREVEAFDAEQGRSRIAKYIEEAVIEPATAASAASTAVLTRVLTNFELLDGGTDARHRDAVARRESKDERSAGARRRHAPKDAGVPQGSQGVA